VQEFNPTAARLQAGMLFLATIALLIPSALSGLDAPGAAVFTKHLSLSLSVILIAAYALSLLFSLKTLREAFSSVVVESADESEEEAAWPIGLALATLAAVTVLVALVSEIFVESVQGAAETLGMTPAFVGFMVVALVGAAAEMVSAFAAARTGCDFLRSRLCRVATP
jgi:Ca2+:H+ antiporter